jgi:pentose-5-phosphate-3-epimerase
MTRYVVKYAEENYGIIMFDAVNKEEAEEWVRKLEVGDIEVEQLFNYSTKVKSASYSLSNLEEVTPPLPEIPIHGIIV